VLANSARWRCQAQGSSRLACDCQMRRRQLRPTMIPMISAGRSHPPRSRSLSGSLSVGVQAWIGLLRLSELSVGRLAIDHLFPLPVVGANVALTLGVPQGTNVFRGASAVAGLVQVERTWMEGAEV